MRRYGVKLRAVRKVSNQPVRFSIVEKDDPIGYYNCHDFDLFCTEFLKNQRRIGFGITSFNDAFPMICHKNGATAERMESVIVVSNREIIT